MLHLTRFQSVSWLVCVVFDEVSVCVMACLCCLSVRLFALYFVSCDVFCYSKICLHLKVICTVKLNVLFYSLLFCTFDIVLLYLNMFIFIVFVVVVVFVVFGMFHFPPYGGNSQTFGTFTITKYSNSSS